MKVEFRIRKTLEGNMIIYDHPRIDIHISPSKKKISLLPKSDANEDVYPAMKRFLNEMISKGLIQPESVSSGTIFNSFEAQFAESKDDDSIKVLMKFIFSWMEREKRIYDRLDSYEEEIEKSLLAPDEEHSTELGEIPHRDKKGNNNPYLATLTDWFGWM